MSNICCGEEKSSSVGGMRGVEKFSEKSIRVKVVSKRPTDVLHYQKAEVMFLSSLGGAFIFYYSFVFRVALSNEIEIGVRNLQHISFLKVVLITTFLQAIQVFSAWLNRSTQIIV